MNQWNAWRQPQPCWQADDEVSLGKLTLPADGFQGNIVVLLPGPN